MISLNKFIRQYADAITEGYAAVLAGAGLSRPSGYVNWKELLLDFAESIDLDIEKEHDLIEITQFYCNANGGRGAINDAIYQKFTKRAEVNDTLDTLIQLPIKTYWTTNYDKLLETSLNKAGKKVDVKIAPESLALAKVDRRCIVYKMHGDCDNPSKCVLTKDDYESYNEYRQLFTTALQGDLVSKTFLFIGFSFDDPNLKYILSRIKVLLGENRREHFFFSKKLSKRDFKTKKEYEYAENKRKLQIQDLSRYGINALEIDNYEEIPHILKRISTYVNTKNIFIAGSCRNYGNWDPNTAYNFMYKLGHEIIRMGYNLHSGLIEGVGPQVTNGALTAINHYEMSIEKHLRITTLPLINGKDSHIEAGTKKMFQNDMISEVGIVVFLFGNQYYGGKLCSSKGVYDDYKRAVEQNKFMIPVGSTGFAALDILNEMEMEKNKYSYLNGYWKDLRSQNDPEKLCALIIEIISKIINSI